MKNKQFKLKQLKEKLRYRKEKGDKFVTWSLSKQALEYLIESGYRVEVELFQIKTRTFQNPKNINGILKDIHYTKKKGLKTLTRKLKKDQIRALDEYGVKYYPLKYKIFLKS